MYFFVFILMIWGAILTKLDRYFLKSNGSFRENIIISPLDSSPKWEIANGSIPKEIFSQPFIYWTKGNQTFVFLSQDGKYVLKFYRFSFRFSPLYQLFHGFPKDSYAKIDEAFCSYKMVFEKLSSETRLLFTHLNKTKHQFGNVLLIDKLGRKHLVSLDKTAFLLQERGNLFFKRLHALFSQPEKAKQVIAQTLKLFKNCWEKGILDLDAVWDKNFGMTFDDEPMIIDVGHLKVTDVGNLHEYLFKATEPLRIKLDENAPHLLPIYEDQLNFCCQETSEG